MSEKKRLALGAAAVFLLGSAVHFTYEWLGKSVLAAPFFPVNESVWEHLKLLTTAGFIWMAVDYFLAAKSLRTGFFAARAAAMPLGMLLMTVIYYFLKGAFGVENLIVDIANFLVVAAVYQALALRFERKPGFARYNWLGLAALVLLLLIMAVLTFLPPRLPLFQDPPTGKYGILA